MSVFEIKGISIENQSVIMDISLTEGQVSENIYFLLNDFEETVNGDIISAKENNNQFAMDYKIEFPLTVKFSQFNDGILKIEKNDGETINLSYFIIYSLEKWDTYNDEIEKVEAYFTDLLEDEQEIEPYKNSNNIPNSDQTEEMNKRLITIEDMELSIRSYNCLKRAGIMTLGDLMDKTLDEMQKIRNLGRRSLKEVINKMNDYDVTLLGLDEDFNLDEIFLNRQETENQVIDNSQQNSVAVEQSVPASTRPSYYNIKDLNGYDDTWLDITLTDWKLNFTSNSDNLFAELKLRYKSNYGNILNDLEFYITTNSGSHYKRTGYLNRDGEVPNKIDIWFDGKEHELKIGPTFSIKHTDSIIEDGLRLTMMFKDIKQSYLVRKTYVAEDNLWYHEELFAIPLK
ncbi:DNA-directed RNA polymerase subunit alpha C-terminal domain-containing protein [Thomasclavelia spiroformis]|uniref:DNA-directed RNA polymerase subunit alpha C-terminal domain-containing protein n=1 Tax=Thomasclavelia spiroformis TaxID=29348 RepID=UPI00311A228A